VLAWSNGTTIAFREELEEILGLMAVNGFPPFHAIALLLAACRGKAPAAAVSGPALEETATVPAAATQGASQVGRQLLLRAWNDPANQEYAEFIARLKLLQELPVDLKNSPRAKAVLLEMILEPVRFQRIQPAREIIQVLTDGSLRDDLLNSKRTSSIDVVRLYRQIHESLKRFSPEALAARIQTGLDELPEAADITLEPAARVRQLLAQLQDDPDHQGLAKVTRDIMAALYLPRSLSEMEELALGGFSDISNRGNLDRLLPSELANDDLTLAARVALNEALYFRREPPANHPPGHFAILIDAGVRQWGLPRVFATAVALALIGKENRRGQITSWRATHDGVEKVDLLARQGLVKHLGALETYTHPGASLKLFFSQLVDEPQLECVLITNRDTIDDPEFKAMLAQCNPEKLYIATVDRNGAFQLFLHPNRTSLLCKATISLDVLFPKTGQSKRESLRDERINIDLPLSLSVRPFPLLLTVFGKVEKAMALPSYGGIAAMQDRQLLFWPDINRGASLLLDNLPRGKTLWIGTGHRRTKIAVLKYRMAQKMAMLTVWDQTSGSVHTREFPLDTPPVRIVERNGILFLVYRKQVSALDLFGDERVLTAPIPMPHYLPAYGRYFAALDGSWHCISHNGQVLQFIPVSLPQPAREMEILALFDREGYEGQWTLTKRGEVYSPSGVRVMNLGRVISHVQISDDGDRLMVTSVENGKFDLLDLKTTKTTTMKVGLAKVALEPSISFPTRNVRTNFNAIGFTADGHPRLRTPQGLWFGFTDQKQKSLQFNRCTDSPPEPASVRYFHPVRTVTEFGFRLRVASWNDGTKAWLDSRAILHLKSGSPSAPEVSVLLVEGNTAAWSSDRQLCGPAFHIADAESIEGSAMIQKIQALSPKPLAAADTGKTEDNRRC
jgi:MoxR-vWA-beta-propeller ternary system domain bpX0/MoxR-vWA-beta-propeller ternary system domain bpX1